MTQSKDERENQVRQLSLPLQEEPVREEPPVKTKAVRRPKQGFMRDTRDSDVAQSYSDNVALGYAVARGLAEVLASMSPADLAALRARVAQSAERAEKKTSKRRPPLGGWAQES